MNHARMSQSGIARVWNFPSGVNVNAPVIVLTDGVVFAIESDVVSLHGCSFGGLTLRFRLKEPRPLSPLNLRLVEVDLVFVGVRNRHKEQVVGVALFIHVLDELPEVSLVGGRDVGESGRSEKVAVVGFCVLHGFSFLNIDVFESKDGAGLSLRQFKVEQLQASGVMLNDGFALGFVCLGRRCAFKVLDCLSEGLQEFGLKVGGECHGFSFRLRVAK